PVFVPLDLRTGTSRRTTEARPSRRIVKLYDLGHADPSLCAVQVLPPHAWIISQLWRAIPRRSTSPATPNSSERRSQPVESGRKSQNNPNRIRPVADTVRGCFGGRNIRHHDDIRQPRYGAGEA